MLRSDFGSALMSGAQKSGALELVNYTDVLHSLFVHQHFQAGKGEILEF